MQTIQILHTNDIHSSIDSFAKLAHYVSGVRTRNANTLVIDGGDLNTGTIYNMLFNGELEIELANALNYNLMAIGNHDLDFGINYLAKFVNNANTTFINSNLTLKTDQRFATANIKKSHIIEMAGIKIGFCGAITNAIDYKFANEQQLSCEIDIESLKRESKELRRQGCQLIIAINHIGYEADVVVAKQIADINIIISAHSHTFLEKPAVVEQTLICQTGAFLKYVGHLELKLENGRIIDYNYHQIELADYPFEKADVKMIIDDAQKIKNEKYNQKLSINKTRLEADRNKICYQQTNLGKLVCDSFLFASGQQADFAVINARGVRRSLPAGEVITLEKTFEILPFNRNIVLLKICGQDLIDAISTGHYAQTANLEVIMQSDGTINLYESSTKQLVPINPEKYYKLVTNTYLSEGNSYYTAFKNATKIADYGLDYIVLAKYINTLEDGFEYTAK